MSLRRVRTLVRREVLATFRSPFTVIILIAVPNLALLLFGFVLSTEVNGLRLGVQDADRTATSRRIVADATATGTFKAIDYTTREALERAMVGGDINAAIIIPPGFERTLQERRGRERPEVQLLYDGAEPVLAGNADAFLRSFVRASTTAAAGTAAPGIRVVPQALFNPKLDGKPFMVSGVFGFVLSFLTTMLTAVSIVNEKLQGTFEQLQVTPATSTEILAGKLLPLGAIFALDVLLMALLAGFVIGVWPAGSLLFFLLISAFYVLVSLSLGLIFSATSATPAEAVQKTVLFSLPLIQLSGFVFPIRSMPLPVQWIVEIFPATHYIRLSRAIYIRGEGPIDLVWQLVPLLLFGGALLWYARRTIEARA